MLMLAGAALVAVLTFGLGAWAFGLGRDDGEKVDTYYNAEIPPCSARPDLIKTPSSPAPAPGAWRKEADSPMGRDEAAAAQVGTKVYMVGGHKIISGIKNPWEQWSTDRGVVFDTKTGTYSEMPRLPHPVDHAGAAAYKGDVYVIGGWSQGKDTNDFFRFDPRTGEWSRMPPMKDARGALQARVVGDKLYAIGGSSPTLPNPDVEPLGTVEVFDFNSGAWSRAPSMPTGRHHFGTAVLDGKIYAAAGRHKTNYHVTEFERYDPVANKWEELPRLPQGVSAPTMVATDREIVVAAGADERAPFVTPAVWAFDPATNRWRRLPDLEVARHAGVGAYVNGRIYVFEGSPCPGYGGTQSVESLPVT